MPAAAQVGQSAPPFALRCTDLSGREWQTSLADLAGQWLILIFYPRDFSFVCPTELTAFSARVGEFQKRACRLLGISVDSVELHREWLTTPPEQGGLGPLQFPLASDPDGAVARAFGIWDEEKKLSTRGLFILDPQSVLQYAAVHNLNVGRNAEETLRVLEALQSGGLCPASWTRADGTLNVGQLLQPGRILSHYRLRHMLGQGTFGTVFAAWDLHLERMVALKIFFKGNLEARDLLFSEARAAARLNHPNVCTIYAVEELEGLPVIVMEFLDGEPLTELIGQPLPATTVRSLAGALAGALAAAHKIPLVHGDLKPANIIVTRDRVPKILDFGLARLHSAREQEVRRCWQEQTAEEFSANDQEVDATLVRPSVPQATAPASCDGPDNLDDTRAAPRRSITGLSGTPAYMSPEQALSVPTSPASDVFSFGLIVYEMLTGRRALNETGLLPLLKRLRAEDFAATLASQVSADCRDLLGKMLARDASRRPSMAAIADFFAR